jgi:hypothetical protein
MVRLKAIQAQAFAGIALMRWNSGSNIGTLRYLKKQK